MAQPDVFSVHADRPLVDVSIAYIQSQDHFIANQIFPVISVDKKSDQYWTYTQADWFRDEARPRADATESAGSGYNVSTEGYKCEVHALHKDVGDQAVANSDNPLNPFADATRFLTQKMLLKQETKWVSDFFATGKWTTDKTGGTHFTQWNNYPTSNPVEDIEAGKATILESTGYLPNTLVLGYNVFRQLKHHPDIMDRMKYTANLIKSPVDTIILAAVFGLERVLIARAVKNAAIENATDNFSFTHGKHGLLEYVTPQPSLLEATAGYTFMWKGISKGFGTNVSIERWREQKLSAERVEVQMAWDGVLIARNLGYFYSGAVA